MKCPPDKLPWRETKEGPMPLLVPAEQIEHMAGRYPTIWIEAMPAHVKLDGRALMPKDLEHE